jgi:hypothetical protein
MTIADDSDRGNNGRNPQQRSRALELLRRIESSGSVERHALAQALVVRPATLESYLHGTIPIPLERQLCLALYVIEHIPELARQGHQLRGQVAAAIAFRERATFVHSEAPPTRF